MAELKLQGPKMHSDITKKLNSINKPQTYLHNKLSISRSTLWRLNVGRPITLETFMLLLGWLDAPADKYINSGRTNGRTIYVTETSNQELKERWGVPCYYKSKVYIRCNAAKIINWDKAVVYGALELLTKNNVEII